MKRFSILTIAALFFIASPARATNPVAMETRDLPIVPLGDMSAKGAWDKWDKLPSGTLFYKTDTETLKQVQPIELAPGVQWIPLFYRTTGPVPFRDTLPPADIQPDEDDDCEPDTGAGDSI